MMKTVILKLCFLVTSDNGFLRPTSLDCGGTLHRMALRFASCFVDIDSCNMGPIYLFGFGRTRRLASSFDISPYFDNNGCSTNGSVEIFVHNSPNANAGNDTTICTGTSFQIEATGGDDSDDDDMDF